MRVLASTYIYICYTVRLQSNCTRESSIAYVNIQHLGYMLYEQRVIDMKGLVAISSYVNMSQSTTTVYFLPILIYT